MALTTLTHKQISYLKSEYPPGTRVVLDHMANEPDPVPDGTVGTVYTVDDIGQIFTDWDNGRHCFPINPECDTFHKVQERRES